MSLIIKGLCYRQENDEFPNRATKLTMSVGYKAEVFRHVLISGLDEDDVQDTSVAAYAEYPLSIKFRKSQRFLSRGAAAWQRYVSCELLGLTYFFSSFRLRNRSYWDEHAAQCDETRIAIRLTLYEAEVAVLPYANVRAPQAQPFDHAIASVYDTDCDSLKVSFISDASWKRLQETYPSV